MDTTTTTAHGPHGQPAHTATTVAQAVHKVHSAIPKPPHVPWDHLWLVGLALPLLGLLIYANRRMNQSAPQTGGSGRVVGIVGRMGSGKSYMAVRMAIRRMKRGANVVTNFTMNLDGRDEVNAMARDGAKPKAIAQALGMTVGRVKVLTGLTGEWSMFRGWEQFATLENAVVIIDEAHLYAPSNKSLVFPDVARFKMSQARKFKLDVYWITQHENRVNSILKDLTNMMFVCRSWMSGTGFTVKGYEPEHMRRKGKHLERQLYRLNVEVAGLYNTLEILAADDHLMKSAGMATAAKVSAEYNAKTLTGSAAERAAAVHHEAAARQEPGRVMADHAKPPKPSPSAAALVAPVTAAPTEPTEIAPVVPIGALVAVQSPPKATRTRKPKPVQRTRPRSRKCKHELRGSGAAGSCAICPPELEAIFADDGVTVLGWS